jgi:carbon monoxide dehydrogenase subunit G
VELSNEFRVGVPLDEAWAVLTDVERIAPCMPGAELQEVAGDEYRGIVKIKVGPITAQYKGTARFLEKDDVGHKAVLRAEGRDTRGQGNANATVTATLVSDADGTTVRVDTDLTVTGKVAQFGRGVLADVSTKLLNQFVSCLEKDLAAAVPAAPAEVPEPSGRDKADISASSRPKGPEDTEEQAEPEVRRIDSKPAEPVDLFDAAGVPLAKRAIPLVAGVLVIIWFLRRRRRHRRG